MLRAISIVEITSKTVTNNWNKYTFYYLLNICQPSIRV